MKEIKIILICRIRSSFKFKMICLLSDLLFYTLKESISDLQTEEQFFRWVEQLVGKTPFSVQDCKMMLLRAHRESHKLKFIDQLHEDLIFECLYRTWTNMEKRKPLDSKGSGLSPDVEQRLPFWANNKDECPPWRHAMQILLGNKENTVPLQMEPKEGKTVTQSHLNSLKLVDTSKKRRKVRYLNDIDPKAILRRRYRRQYARTTVQTRP